jgi:hypothetical protein
MDMNMRPDTQEAAMARADLYKMANYSFKLFKMIRDGDQLEGWVQAKITKAADYVASVYHYLEYEMKFSEYGASIENSDMYSEAVKQEFRTKLMEAKKKLEKLNSKNQKELDEVFGADAKVGDKAKTTKGTATKTKTGMVHTRDKYDYDPGSDDKEMSKVKRDARNKKVKEGAKPDFLDMDKDGNKKEPMKKAVADKKAGPKKGVNPFAKKTTEALKGGQKNLDVDKDGKLEKSDFAKLRSKKTTEAADKCNHTAKGKSCPVHGMKECGSMYEGNKFDPLKHVEKKSQTPPLKKAAKDVDRKNYGDRAAIMKAGGVKDTRGPRGVTQG